MTVLNKTVGNEIFLQGKYLSIGVNSSGDIGTRQSAPTGFTTDKTYSRVGLLADTDGFGTGAEAMRDAVTRGAPIEGFNIGYKTGGSTYIHSNQEMDGLLEIAGTVENASTAHVGEADWMGATKEKLSIDQKITLGEDDKFIRFEITLTNNSGAAMNDLRYMRTVDPDLAEGFATINTIVKQGADGALITAAGSASGNPMFLYADDPRAVVTSYGFINENPYEAAVSTAQKVGTVTKTDMSLNLNFVLGTLNPGSSTTVVFYMGVTDNLAATIAEIDALGITTTPTTPTPPANTAPDAINDTLAIVAGETGKGNVLANDKDANGDALTATLKTGPAHGTVTLAADGSYVYKAAAGYVGADSFTYTASDGKASDAAAVAITVKAPTTTPTPTPTPTPVNKAPDAIGDILAIVAGETARGNVLANDKDANGDALTAKLKTGPSHGTVTLDANGNFVYKAAAGFVGVDSFTYTASDGKASDASKVAITVAAPPVTVPSVVTKPGLPDSPLLQRDGTVDGSASTADTLTGATDHNSFFLDLGARTGVDKVTNFGRSDILVTKGALLDGNGDGIIAASKSKLTLGDGDTVTLSGVSSLRYLGTDDLGLSVYGNAATKPKGAIEGKISDDVLTGDVSDLKKNVFFFDTGLDIDLGHDRIANFGAKDMLVTTHALSTTALGKDGTVDLVGDSGALGTIELDGIGGGAVQNLEFDGSVQHGGVTYYVYSQAGSLVDVGDLSF